MQFFYFRLGRTVFHFICVMAGVFHDCCHRHSYYYFSLYHFTKKNTLPPLWVNISSKNSQAVGYIATRWLERDASYIDQSLQV